MQALVVTNMYPTRENPYFGIFVKEQVESVRAHGVDVDVIFVNGRDQRWGRAGYARGPAQLWSALAKRQYDVVHAHYVFSGIIARLQWQAPLVVTHHGIEVQDGWQGALCKHTRRFTDQLIVVARWMREAIDAPQAHIIPCGVDRRIFRPHDQREARRILGLNPGHRYVLFAGEIWRPEKRGYLVEAALTALRETHPDIHLLAVTKEPHDRIPLYMSAADVLVTASTCEGSPMVVKEAMACGLPIVATDAGDAWGVMDGVSGCYRAKPEPEDIAGCILSAVSPPRRTDGALRASNFDLDVVAEKVIGVYERAIAGRQASVAEEQYTAVRRRT